MDDIVGFWGKQFQIRRNIINERGMKIGGNLGTLESECYVDAYLMEQAKLDAEKGKNSHLFHGNKLFLFILSF